MANTQGYRVMGSMGWALGAVIACGAAACGPRISVGNTGEEGGAAGYSGAVGTTGGTVSSGGSKSTSGGSQASGGSAGSGPSGGASSGGTGGEPDSSVCAPDFSQVVEQPTPDCPATSPSDSFTACGIDENAICVWQTAAGFDAYGCYRDEGGQKVWSGNSVSAGEAGGIHDELCPHTPVPAGESCADHEDQVCRYPSEMCVCERATSTWKCNEFPIAIGSPPIELERVCSPVDESKLLRDLTDEELDIWCRWSYSVRAGGSGGIFGPSQPPYDARNYGSFWGGLHGNVCQPNLPPDLCARNVRLKPGCDATVRTFNDCVETIQGAGAFAGTVVGHGCAPLLDNSSCAGVVVMKGSNAECPLPLD